MLAYVDGLEFEEEPTGKSLLDPKLKREKMKLEIKEAMELPELSDFRILLLIN